MLTSAVSFRDVYCLSRLLFMTWYTLRFTTEQVREICEESFINDKQKADEVVEAYAAWVRRKLAPRRPPPPPTATQAGIFQSANRRDKR